HRPSPHPQVLRVDTARIEIVLDDDHGERWVALRQRHVESNTNPRGWRRSIATSLPLAVTVTMLGQEVQEEFFHGTPRTDRPRRMAHRPRRSGAAVHLHWCASAAGRRTGSAAGCASGTR